MTDHTCATQGDDCVCGLRASTPCYNSAVRASSSRRPQTPSRKQDRPDRNPGNPFPPFCSAVSRRPGRKTHRIPYAGRTRLPWDSLATYIQTQNKQGEIGYQPVSLFSISSLFEIITREQKNLNSDGPGHEAGPGRAKTPQKDSFGGATYKADCVTEWQFDKIAWIFFWSAGIPGCNSSKFRSSVMTPSRNN